MVECSGTWGRIFGRTDHLFRALILLGGLLGLNIVSKLNKHVLNRFCLSLKITLIPNPTEGYSCT